jgi:hypothetical protein
MAEPGTLFSYLSAFVTIVLAVAFADMAASLHRLIRARARVKWHPLPLAVALFVLLTLATLFFELWTLTRVERITYFQLVWLLAPQFVYFLAASAVLPDKVPEEGIDLLGWYMAERRYLLAVFGLAMFLDAVGGILDGWPYFKAHPDFFWGFFVPANAAVFVMLAIMWSSRRVWVHALALLALYAIAYNGYGSWSIRGAPAVVKA